MVLMNYSLSRDKVYHLIAGFILTAIGFSVFNFLFFGVIFAFGKELYDYISRRGKAEWSDILYTLIGCLIALILPFGFNIIKMI